MKRYQKSFVLLGICIVFSCAGKINPEPDAMMISGINCYEKSKYDEAIECFKMIAKKDDSTTEVFVWLGRSFLKKEGPEHIKSAILEFKKAQKRDNSKENLLLIKDAFLSRAAEYLVQEEEYMGAVCYLAYSENFHNEDVEALINIARIYNNIGNLPAALSYAKRAYALDPDNREIIDIITLINPI